jgi:uncharacterized membrane protein
VAIPEILIGVAVAVALLPPAAVSGIGLATHETQLFLGGLILTLVNLLGLQLGGIIILRIRGVTPRRYYQTAEARTESLFYPSPCGIADNTGSSDIRLLTL